MRTFLIAFAVLSTLVMAQNVVASTPVESTSSERAADPTQPALAAATSQAGLLPSNDVPEPTTLLLFVLGVSGLAAAGNRQDPDPA